MRIYKIFFIVYIVLGFLAVNHAQAREPQGGDDIFEVAKIGSVGQILDAYRLSKYDVVNLMAVGFPDGLGVGDVVIGPDGYAQLPYVGTVKLAGLTVDEANAALTERLGEYIKISKLSVMIKSYGPQNIQVAGEVKNPGIYSLPIDAMNIYAAISKAGGIATHGRPKHVQIIRTVNDAMYIKEIDLDAYIKKHDMNQNIRLKDGDIIYVPRSNKIDLKEDILPYIGLYGVFKNLSD